MIDSKLAASITAKDVSNSSHSTPDTHDNSAKSTKSAHSKFSITSIETTTTGESSRTGSTMNSTSQDGDLHDRETRSSLTGKHRSDGDGTIKPAEPETRTSHSGRRNIRSGGFLLSDTGFGASGALPKILKSHRKSKGDGNSTAKTSSRDSKGKNKTSDHDKTPRRRRDTGSSIGSSPLAAVVNAASDAEMEKPSSNQATGESNTTKAPQILDADSAQIVNLALNLSESRRIASRRNVSVSMPPQNTLTGEGPVAVGGSLRQHMQQSQQRRSSRNISPKSDRAVLRNVDSQRAGSPLQSHPDGGYEYHFSESTLARAEKAKKAIELAAQYRRLLQYVPPLKPQQLTRTSTISPSGTAPSSPSTSNLPLSHTTSIAKPIRTLGRPYNPLQYVRNRKVRLRERKFLDGATLGLDDVAKVKSWVDQVSAESADEQYQTNDCVVLPPFNAGSNSTTGITPLSASTGKSAFSSIKARRPRMDWTINAEDMIADVIWLEEDDNKKLIEDREGRKIFPAYTELKRPMSRESVEPQQRVSIDIDRRASESDRGYRSEGVLPHFQTIQEKPEHDSENSRGRARRKLQNKLRIQHPRNGSHDHEYHFWHSHSRSSSSSSSSSSDSSKSRKRDSLDVRDPERDILEKQMVELLAAEARHSVSGIPGESRDPKGQAIIKSIESQKAALRDEVRDTETRADANANSNSKLISNNTPSKSTNPSLYSPSPRASLDVDPVRGRSSFEIYTAPSSPSIHVWGADENFFQGVAPEAVPSLERQRSLTRNPIEKARSKINEFVRDRSHDRGRASLEVDGELRRRSSSRTRNSESPEPSRSRSISPAKKLLPRKKDDESKISKRLDSTRRRPDDEPSSGLRGLFKSSRLDDMVRGPVSRVSDMIWKKESGSAVQTDSSSDDSDMESDASRSKKLRFGKLSKSSTYEDGNSSKHLTEPKSFVDAMPTFSSPFESRGRPPKIKEESFTGPNTLHHVRTDSSRQGEKFERLKPPRIDISAATPSSTPKFEPVDRRESNNSDVSSTQYGRGTDERINAFIGLPGTAGRGDRGPMMTGLANLDPGSPQIPRHRENLSPGHSKPRQWSISDREPSMHRGAVNRREIARVRALLLSSGIKAKEISRRAAEVSDLRKPSNLGPCDADKLYAEVATFVKDSSQLKSVPRSQQHILATRILSQDIQASSMIWQKSANAFTNSAIPDLLHRIDEMKAKVRDGCMERVRVASDEADSVAMEIVGEWTMAVKRLSDTMESMRRRRRRRFRWARRGGWMALEWMLVGVMWWVWLIVVVCKILKGSVTGFIGGVRWLLWL